jgi:DNA-binding NarL/FixJ family response regulator
MNFPTLTLQPKTEDVPNTVLQVKKLHPDVLVLDIQMLGGSGIDVLKELKESNALPDTVIMITNYPYPQYKDRCLKEGAHYFLDKTNESDRVIDILQQLMKQSNKSSFHKNTPIS